MYGKDFDPIIKMVGNAIKMQELIDDKEGQKPEDMLDARKTVIDSWDKIAQYVQPKLKAVEVSGELDSRILVRTIDLSGKKEETADNNADD
jgi:hypothetical protein